MIINSTSIDLYCVTEDDISFCWIKSEPAGVDQEFWGEGGDLYLCFQDPVVIIIEDQRKEM